MNNPFMYGKPVSGDYFFHLPKLSKELRDFVFNKISVVIIGNRRSGKTSFLGNFLEDQKSKGLAYINVDVFNITSHRDFLIQLINSISKEKSYVGTFFDWLKVLGTLTPVIKNEIDPGTGAMNFSVSLNKFQGEDIKQSIIHALNGIPQLSKDIIFSIDEFQKIGELEDRGWLEATLRTKMQEYPQVRYIFTGSRRSLIEDMFNNSKRPFFKSCKVIHFPSFGVEFTDWIISRFREVDFTCTRDAVNYLRMRVDDVPHYVQEICFHIVSHGIKNVTPKEVDEILSVISTQSTYSYEALLNTLTVSQIRLLRMLVNEGKADYSKKMLEKYEFKTSSQIQYGIKALIEKQIIEFNPENKIIEFDDPLFKLWLQEKYK